jgi:hypothetical protein
MSIWVSGVRQEELEKRGYSATDAVILSYLKNLFTSSSKKLKRIYDGQGRMYTYVSPELTIKNLPILKITPHTFQTNYLKKYTKAGILKRIEKRIYYTGNGKFFHHKVYFYRFSTTQYFQLLSRLTPPSE